MTVNFKKMMLLLKLTVRKSAQKLIFKPMFTAIVSEIQSKVTFYRGKEKKTEELKLTKSTEDLYLTKSLTNLSKGPLQ